MFKKKSDEELKYDFLPSALDIIERPASPLGKVIIIIVAIFMIAVIAWSCIAQIDEVAIVSGKVVPKNGVQSINSNMSGKITKVYKQEGDKVKKGDIILEIENTDGTSGKDRIKKQIELNKLKLDIVNCKLNNVSIDGVFVNHPEVESNEIEEIKLQEQISRENEEKDNKDYNKSLSEYDERIAELNKQLNDETQRFNDFDSKKEEETLEDIFGDSNKETKEDIQKNIDDLKKQIESENEEKNNYISNHESSLESKKLSYIQERNGYESSIKDAEENLKNIDANNDRFYIKSNIDGEILTLKYNTKDVYINAMEPIAEVVSDDSELEIETMIENQDISRVHEGDDVVIKLAAYDYQKYGYLTGEITYIAPNAIVDENLGAVYKAKIKFDKNEKEAISVIPGMTGNLEINTGKIRIIDYFLKPFEKTIDESMKG